jgi:hypothetical protein
MQSSRLACRAKQTSPRDSSGHSGSNKIVVQLAGQKKVSDNFGNGFDGRHLVLLMGQKHGQGEDQKEFCGEEFPPRCAFAGADSLTSTGIGAARLTMHRCLLHLESRAALLGPPAHCA